MRTCIIRTTIQQYGCFKWMLAWLTVLERVEYCSPERNLCTQCCHLRYCLKPTPPGVKTKTITSNYFKLSPILLYLTASICAPSMQMCTDVYLFLYILEIRAEHLNENGHRPSLDDHTCLVGCSWCDVGQNPRCFKLHRDRVCVTILQKSIH